MGVSGDGACDASVRAPFGGVVNAEIRKHAVEAYPEECCGIVVDGKYIRSKNVAEKPEESFEIEPELLQTFANQIQGIAHSHPKVMPYPSKLDMEQQVLWDVPWAIASITCDGRNPPFCMDLFWFGDTLPRLPLRNRVFRPGVQDCYALARDYYYGQGIELPEMPRDHSWWMRDEETGRPAQNLFVDLLDASGFEIIKPSEVKAGDGFACPYGTSIICHCGVLIDNDHVLHHLALKPSEVAKSYRWIERTVQGGKFFRVRKDL